mmetsp:Transcript_145803/g.465849  ORF Transcript_145803/g.465849 Transcript_145803/m.465849 type:complete len:230 (-) Transcript_145803:22-711(-)
MVIGRVGLDHAKGISMHGEAHIGGACQRVGVRVPQEEGLVHLAETVQKLLKLLLRHVQGEVPNVDLSVAHCRRALGDDGELVQIQHEGRQAVALRCLIHFLELATDDRELTRGTGHLELVQRSGGVLGCPQAAVAGEEPAGACLLDFQELAILAAELLDVPQAPVLGQRGQQQLPRRATAAAVAVGTRDGLLHRRSCGRRRRGRRGCRRRRSRRPPAAPLPSRQRRRAR